MIKRKEVVEVRPAKFPPVKYKGRIWVRIGPRKGIANEDDERRLYEKRVANITTFDAMPCIGATLDDLDIVVFAIVHTKVMVLFSFINIMIVLN